MLQNKSVLHFLIICCSVLKSNFLFQGGGGSNIFWELIIIPKTQENSELWSVCSFKCVFVCECTSYLEKVHQFSLVAEIGVILFSKITLNKCRLPYNKSSIWLSPMCVCVCVTYVCVHVWFIFCPLLCLLSKPACGDWICPLSLTTPSGTFKLEQQFNVGSRGTHINDKNQVLTYFYSSLCPPKTGIYIYLFRTYLHIVGNNFKYKLLVFFSLSCLVGSKE